MTRLAHPNVVEVLDFGRGEGGDYFLVLEFVEGADLGRISAAMRARGEPFPIALALYVATQALRGLHHAHTRAAEEGSVLVHRDVSPSNVLLSVEGEVKIADFGVSLVRRADEHRPAGGVVGKPAYMAPEQYEGREIDPRADIFAVGVVLFELVTGSLPFEGHTEGERQDAARRGDFGRARDVRHDVTPALDAILRRALAPNAEARFPDAKAMARAIGECGAPMATSDDAAEAVRAALISLRSQGRRVLALSAGRPREEDVDVTGQELTRTGDASGAAAFTLKVSDAPYAAALREPPATPEGGAATTRRDVGAPRAPQEASGEEPSDPSQSLSSRLDERSAVISRRRRLGVVAVGALISAGIAAIAVSRIGHPRGDGQELSPVIVPSASTPPPEPSSPRVDAIDVAPQPLPSAPLPRPATVRSSPHAPVIMTSMAPIAPSLSASSAAPIAPSAAPIAPSADCSGTVKIASNGSYTVSGGPGVVQSPGVYTWRCGTYALSAVSRADPSQKKASSVVVRAGGSSFVDLR